MLDRGGATLKEAMQLARRSDPKLTMAVYGRAQLRDLGEAVQRLPALLEGPATIARTRAATGTDGETSLSRASGSPPAFRELATSEVSRFPPAFRKGDAQSDSVIDGKNPSAEHCRL